MVSSGRRSSIAKVWSNEFRDVGQIRRDDAGVVGDDPVVYAAVELAAVSLAAIFQGSNSSMRLMG